MHIYMLSGDRPRSMGASQDPTPRPSVRTWRRAAGNRQEHNTGRGLLFYYQYIADAVLSVAGHVL